MLGDVFQNAYPNWTVGVPIGYPLGTSTAQANLARARLQYEQAQTQLKNLELQIATQVRDAARNVQTNQKRVQSARASRELQEKKLEAEEKKFAAGMSTSFFVFQAQRDLAQARTAGNPGDFGLQQVAGRFRGRAASAAAAAVAAASPPPAPAPSRPNGIFRTAVEQVGAGGLRRLGSLGPSPSCPALA